MTSQRYPSGCDAAACLTFDFDAEEVWLADDPAYANMPGVLSQGAYGAKVGVPQVLEILARRSVKATFFVPGKVALRHPERVEAIVAGGHELAHHGYSHRSPAPMRVEEEERELLRGRDILGGFTSDPIVGYRSPSWDFSPNTLGLLRRHEFEYSSNLMDDISPYIHPGTSTVEIPVQWILDDAAHWWFSFVDSWTKKISTTQEVREIWQEELVGIASLGGCCTITMHPQIIGRPSRLAFLDEFIGFVKGMDGVYLGTCREIASCTR